MEILTKFNLKISYSLTYFTFLCFYWTWPAALIKPRRRATGRALQWRYSLRTSWAVPVYVYIRSKMAFQAPVYRRERRWGGKGEWREGRETERKRRQKETENRESTVCKMYAYVSGYIHVAACVKSTKQYKVICVSCRCLSLEETFHDHELRRAVVTM